jgi:hypothetical protein
MLIIRTLIGVLQPMNPLPPEELQHGIGELAYRHKLRDVLLARQPTREDARELAEIAFERAALACGLLRLAEPSSTETPKFTAEALDALAEGAAASAAAVLGYAKAEAEGSADVELRWPDQRTRQMPLGGISIGPSIWFRGLACALAVRDAEALDILCYPEHIEAIQWPPHLADAFWGPLCNLAAAVVRGTPPATHTFELSAALLAPDRIVCADAAVVQAQIAPLVPLLRGLSERHGFTAVLRHALDTYRAYYDHNDLPNDPYRGVALEVLGLAALAQDRGLNFDPCDLPVALVTGSMEPAHVTVTFAYRLRLAERPEDATGFLDLRGFARGGREHVVLSRGKELVAHYSMTGCAGMPRVTAEFQLADVGATVELPPPALDAGERLLLAELYAREAGVVLAEGDPRRAKTWLISAVEMVDAVLASIPADADQVPETAFVNPLGRAAYDAEPGRFRRARMAAYRESLANQLHQLDDQPATDSEPDRYKQAAPGDFDSRAAAYASIEIIRAQVTPILEAIARDRSGEVVRLLRSRPDDYAKVFVGAAVERARQAYEAMWNTDLNIAYPSTEQTVLLCYVAPAGMLADDNELSRHFPGGYKALAPWLNPHRMWVCWKYVRPGETSGLAYNGLVWCDDHWAWFPKPYTILRGL